MDKTKPMRYKDLKMLTDFYGVDTRESSKAISEYIESCGFKEMSLEQEYLSKLERLKLRGTL